MTPEESKRLEEIRRVINSQKEWHDDSDGELGLGDERFLLHLIETLEGDLEKANELIRSVYAEKLMEIPFDTTGDLNNSILEHRRRLFKDRIEAYCIHNKLTFQFQP